MALRPDELAANAEVERYEKNKARVTGGLKKAVGFGSALIGAGMASKVAPFLSEYVPMDLALKGINKVSPQLGKFIRKGMDMGLDAKEGLDFIKKKLNPDGSDEALQDKPKSSDRRRDLMNNLGEASPEMMIYLQKQIDAGKSPRDAARMVKGIKSFDRHIKTIEEKHKQKFEDLVESEFMQEKSAPKESQASQNLIAALQAAAQARQRRQAQ